MTEMSQPPPLPESYDHELPPPPGRGLDIGRCFSEAFEFYRQNFLFLFLAAIIYEMLSILTLSILMGPLSGGCALMLLSAWRRGDRRVDLGDIFGAFDHRFFPLMGMFYLTTICTFLAMIFLILPGVLVATCWLFCFFLFIDKRMGVFQSLGASYRVVARKDFGMAFLLVLIIFGLSLAAGLIPFLGILLAWLVTPLNWGLTLSAYNQLVLEDDGTLDDIFREEVPAQY